MNVIHVVLGKANPDRMNGVNKAVHNLAAAQVACGNAVEVWGLTRDPGAATPPRPYRLRLFALRRGPVLPPPLKAAIREAPPGAVFHVHGCFIPVFARLAGHLRRSGLPYFVTPHGAMAPAALRTSRWAKAAYWTLFERRVLSGARGVHAVGATEQESLGRMLPGRRVILVPNGQDLGEVGFDGPLAPRPADIVYGYCGRLDWKHKGVDLLIEGFAAHASGSGGGVLWVIGDGADRARSEALARRLGVAERVRFFGALFGQEKLRTLAAMDGFVHPSRYEGFPMSVLEAAALARPLVVSLETNVGEYVSRFGAGVVLAENTPAAIAAALSSMERARRDGVLVAWGAGARRMIETELNWRSVAGRLVEEYAR